jgi:ethanolamine utilization protein EutJ
VNYEKANNFIKDFCKVAEEPIRKPSKTYYTGVDLGTACVVVAVLDEDRRPVAGRWEYADVVRDGMVVDFMRAIDIVKRMKAEIEEELDSELVNAAAAIPPGTGEIDGGAVRNVVTGAGFTLTNLLDEPTAANELLGIVDGAVVDIGGGTTGVSILRDGKVVSVTDEATGGIHFTLVISGAYSMTIDEAELYKRDENNHAELLPVVRPVVEKVATIIDKQTKGKNVKEIALVGGACRLAGMEKVVENVVGIPCGKPCDPLFVTPLGIALSCGESEL